MTVAVVIAIVVIVLILVTVFCALIAGSRADDMDEAFREHLNRQRDPRHNGGPER